MKKVLWFSLGVTVGAFGYARLRRHWSGLGNVNRAVATVADRTDYLYRTFHHSMREREERLQRELGVGFEEQAAPSTDERGVNSASELQTSQTPLVSRRRLRKNTR